MPLYVIMWLRTDHAHIFRMYHALRGYTMPSFSPGPLLQLQHIAQQLVGPLAQVLESLHPLQRHEAPVIAVEEKSLRLGVCAAGSHVDEKG